MILDKLRRLLTALHCVPDRVISLPDRDSEIIARAAASVLGVSFALAPPVALAQSHTLLVAADNRQIGDWALVPVLEGQAVFALNLHWLHRGGPTPDIAGVLSQSLILPWSGDQIQVDPETREISHPPADTRPAEIVARDLVAVEPEQDPHFEDTLDFYVERARFLKGGSAGGRARLPFYPDSPVPGTYFS
jgi:hypothetical protein